MKWVTISAEFKDGYDTYYPGERIKATDEQAQNWCAAGWAVDESGEIKTGSPNKDDVGLSVQSTKHKASSTKGA